jgi:hypothetical protein
MQFGFAARTSNVLLLEDAVVRTTNCAMVEEAKKKNDEKVRKAEREKAKFGPEEMAPGVKGGRR